MTWAVTTCANPTEAVQARARLVAERGGVRLVERRRSLRAALDEAGVDVIYVVGRARDELRSRDERLAVTRGLTHARLRDGATHPLVRALDLPTDPRGVHLVDATLGLAGDALHLAGLGAEVTGIEGSPAVFSLLEEGLRRLATEGLEAAARVQPRLGLAADVLARLGASVAHGVVLSPMYAAPQAAPPGYELLRAVALHHPLDARTLDAALAVAPRVVVKVEPGRHLAVPHTPDRVSGRAVDYLVFTG